MPQPKPRSDRADSRAPGSLLLAPPTGVHPGEALVLLGIGSFGATVLQILSQEFARFRIPKGQVYLLALDPYGGAQRVDGIPDDLPPPLIQPFDRMAYVEQQESLRQALSHLPAAALQGQGPVPPRLPGQGLVDLHHDDELLFTGKMLTLVDEARSSNPDRLVRCIAVWALDDAFASGAAPPILFRVREHLEHRKVTLEAFLVSASRVREAPTAGLPHDVDSACIDVASAMLWERIILGDRDIPYPGKAGVREERLFRGPLAHRTWVFSGAGSSSPSAVASTVGRCIETLSTTRLGRRLEAERVRYTEDLLERKWVGPHGVRHPTALLSLNVAGLKLDLLPAIFHLRRARRILDSWTAVLSEDEEQILHAEAERLLENAGITDAAIPKTLHVGSDPLTADEIQQADLPQEQLHAYLSRRLQDDLGTLYAYGDGSRRPAQLPALLAKAQNAIQEHVQALSRPGTGSLLRTIVYYLSLEKHLERRRQRALELQRESQRVLASLADKQRLTTLLERIQRDTTRPKSKHWSFIERFVATMTVSIPMQVRKLLEVAAGVRQLALELATSTILVDVYGQMLHFCERQREDLQVTLRTLNNVASLCSRQEEQMQRTARSAYTYPRTRIENLLHRLWERLADHITDPTTNLDELSQPFLQRHDDEAKWYERTLRLARPQAEALAEATNEIMASEPLVREALKECLAQFAPTVQIDRDRFAQLETARLRFVLCTRWMYEVNRDLFEGYEHIETHNPYNVLVSQHEEGLPFIALRCMRRAQEHYRAAQSTGGTLLAHGQARFATELPLLDD